MKKKKKLTAAPARHASRCQILTASRSRARGNKWRHISTHRPYFTFRVEVEAIDILVRFNRRNYLRFTSTSPSPTNGRVNTAEISAGATIARCDTLHQFTWPKCLVGKFNFLPLYSRNELCGSLWSGPRGGWQCVYLAACTHSNRREESWDSEMLHDITTKSLIRESFLDRPTG